MYCTKCGKEVRTGDVYCSGCGQKIGAKVKKGKGWILLAICAVSLCIAAGVIANRESSAGFAPIETFGPVADREIPALEDAKINTSEMLPEAPKDGDLLEESSYANGNPRREVTDYGDTVHITDYRPDATVLRNTTLSYSGGSFAAIRVTNYDDHGNPTDTTETMADGELWLYLYYKNTYDDQGRPLVLAEYNRMDYPLYVYEYTYHDDGSYIQVCTEYRGYVYEYDREYNPLGSTSLFSRSITTFTAQGDVIDQYIDNIG